MCYACSKYRGEERCIKIFVGGLEGQRPHGRFRRTFEDKMKVDFHDV